MLRAQRDSFEDIRAPPDPAIDRDLNPSSRDGCADAQGVEGGGGVIELAAAVVGDDDTVDGVFDGELDVCGVQNYYRKPTDRSMRCQSMCRNVMWREREKVRLKN